MWLNRNVLGLEVGHGHDGVDSNVCHLVMALVDDLGSKGGLGSLDKVAGVLQVDLELVGDLVQVLDGSLGGQLKTIRNPGYRNHW